MADEYVVASGVVQQFGDKPAVATREVNGQNVREFVIKAVGSQKLIRITLWPEWDSVEVGAGDGIIADGKYNVSEKNGTTYYGLTPARLSVSPAASKAPREVVNNGQQATQSSGGSTGGSSPF